VGLGVFQCAPVGFFSLVLVKMVHLIS